MKKYTHLTQEERTLISHYHDNGISIGEIGRKLGRNKSTISRELGRNSNKDCYKPEAAKLRYLSRRKKTCRIDTDAALKAYILERLYEGFTPELISLRLKTFGEQEAITLVQEDPTWQAEFEYFKEACVKETNNLSNDLWIQGKLQNLFSQAQKENARHVA